MIGSRATVSAPRRPHGSSASGAEGPNQEVVRGVDLAVLAVTAGAAVQTAKSLARAIGSTPLLSVASELRFGGGTVRPGSEGPSVAEQVAANVPGPVAAGPIPRRQNALGQPRSRRGRPGLRRRRARQGAFARARVAPRGGPRAGRRVARECPGARGAHGRDRQLEPPLQRARRYPHHLALVSEYRVIGVEGLPEIAEGDDLALPIAGAVELEDGHVGPSSPKAVSKAEGRVRRARRGIQPSRDAAGSPGPRSAPDRGSHPRRDAPSSGSRPPLLIAETRHWPLPRAPPRRRLRRTRGGTVRRSPRTLTGSAERILDPSPGADGAVIAVLVTDSSGGPGARGRPTSPSARPALRYSERPARGARRGGATSCTPPRFRWSPTRSGAAQLVMGKLSRGGGGRPRSGCGGWGKGQDLVMPPGRDSVPMSDDEHRKRRPQP